MATLIQNRKGLMAYIPKDVVFKVGWTKETEVIVFSNPARSDQVVIEKLQQKSSPTPLPKLVKTVYVKRVKENGTSYGFKSYYSDGTKKYKEQRFVPFSNHSETIR